MNNDSLIRVFSSIEGDGAVKTIKLRSDEEFSFQVEVESQPDLPYQMYFLLDGSRSMLSAIEGIKPNSIELAKQVTKKWSGSIVGLGIFNDKETMPFTFVNITLNKLIDNIHTGTEFPFWDMVSGLTNDIDAFSDKIKNIAIKKLTDVDNDPEAHADVISQALTCKDKLGFKEKSDTRHLIFLTTDAPFWIAGDGRFGGIITPPTAECRGSNNAEQSAGSILYDYPSVGFLRHLLELERVYLVASVTNDINEFNHVRSYARINEHIYSALQNELPGLAEYVGNKFNSAENDSSLNPLSVDVVMEKLDEISKRVSLVASGEDTKDFVINFNIEKGSCPGKSKEKVNSDGKVIACENVTKGDKVPINVIIKQKEGVVLDGQKEFFLNLPGVHPKQDLVTVRIQHLDAECTNCGPIDDESKRKYPENCMWGELECGVCKCTEGWHAHDCNCADSEKDKEPAAQKCKQSHTDQETCNGNGDCYCGECECAKNAFGNPFVGSHCQCDPDSCPKGDNEETCWGRGSCICNPVSHEMECVCMDEAMWNSESNCRCRTEDACKDPDFLLNKEICNGRGSCQCEGKCGCNHGFVGDFCERCEQASCMAAICTEVRYQALVACTLEKNCEQIWDRFNISQDVSRAVDNKWKKCTASLGDGCKVYFYVNDKEKNIFDMAIDPAKMCEKPIPIWIIILIVVLIVLFIGLVIIVGWKGYIKYQEKQEYEEFLKAQEGAMRAKGSNPFYQPTENKVDNPLFKRNTQTGGAN